MNFSDRLFRNFFKYKRKVTECCNSIKQKRNFTLSSVQSERVPKILFFGSDNFSLPSLEALYKSNTSSSLGTVTSFKSPVNCVRQYAEKHKMQLYRWPINPEICKNYELGVVVSFGHLIPNEIIKALPLGMINVHASLLPRWRGAAPIIYALMNGDTQTGVTIMRIEPKHFDIGDILAQRIVSIKENCLMPELHKDLASQGAELLIEVVNDFSSKLKNAQKQSPDLVTYAPKVTPALTEVVWSEQSAEELNRRFRALYGFKYLTTKFQSKNIQLIHVQLPASKVTKTSQVLENYKTPGTFLYVKDRKCLLVRCANESFVEITSLRLEGKKIMSAEDFNNGFLKKLKATDVYFAASKNVASC